MLWQTLLFRNLTPLLLLAVDRGLGDEHCSEHLAGEWKATSIAPSRKAVSHHREGCWYSVGTPLQPVTSNCRTRKMTFYIHTYMYLLQSYFRNHLFHAKIYNKNKIICSVNYSRKVQTS